MKALPLLLIFTAYIYGGCAVEERSNYSKQNLLIPPLDTVAIIEEMSLKYSDTDLDLLSSDRLTALDTTVVNFELVYTSFACDCPRWSRTKIAYSENHTRIENASISYYYLEPAHPDLEFPDELVVGGNKFRITAREYVHPRHPNNAAFTDPDPPVGRVLRYYSWQVEKPFKIWGPRVFLGVDDETRDSLGTHAQLIVR